MTTTTFAPQYPMPIKDPDTGEVYFVPEYIGEEPKWTNKPKTIIPDGVVNAVAVIGHSEATLGSGSMAESMIRQVVETNRIDVLLHGCTSGTALWAAKEAIDARIPVISVRPWTHYFPTREDARLFEYVIANSKSVYDIKRTQVSYPPVKDGIFKAAVGKPEPPPYPGDWVFPATDKFLVEQAHKLFVVWNGEPGPVQEAFDLAFKKKPILRYDVENTGFIFYDKEGKHYAQ